MHGGAYFRNFTVLYWCCSAEKFPHPGIMINLFTVKSPESYPTRSYVKEQDILLISYRACFASSSSLKERDTLLCYTFIPPVSSHHSIIA